MNQKTLLLTVLTLIVLLLPALPAQAVIPVAVAPEGGAAAELPFDPQQMVIQARNAFHADENGCYTDNGYRQANFDAAGFTFVPYVGGEPRRDFALGFHLAQIRVGQQTLYSTPLEGGTAPLYRKRGLWPISVLAAFVRSTTAWTLPSSRFLCCLNRSP
jgi:hypothetical protein